MQKIMTYLWFDTQAEEAMAYYTSIFPDSKVGEAWRGPDGNVIAGGFKMAGQEFMVVNGGPRFTFTEAISLFVRCESQAEVDRFWNKFVGDGGEESMCGWLKDKYGLSWQIIPNRLMELLGDKDPERAGRAMQAMLKMRKIDVPVLERAADGK